jgi:hypothetical protein
MVRDRARLVHTPARSRLMLLALALLSAGLGQPLEAQAQGDEFSLDENESSATSPAKPAPTPAEAAAAGQEPALLGDEQAIQEEQAPDEKFRESTDPHEDPKSSYFFVGAAWRYVLLPSFALEWFLDSAPSLATTGSFFGEFGWRKGGFQVLAQAGWMKWHFQGPFQLAGDPPADTEWLNSKLNMMQATATVTWSTSFADWFALEYGIEAGFAVVFGDIIRNEAYHKSGGKWAACPGWYGGPNFPAGSAPGSDAAVYCDKPINGATISNAADEDGAHYGVKAKHGIGNKGIPHAVPVIGPRLSLRFKPIRQLVLRVDIPLPLLPYGFVGGLAAQFGF